MLQSIYWSRDNEWFTFNRVDDDIFINYQENIYIGEGTKKDVDALDAEMFASVAEARDQFIRAAKERLAK